jgi:hypothetical protein
MKLQKILMGYSKAGCFSQLKKKKEQVEYENEI